MLQKLGKTRVLIFLLCVTAIGVFSISSGKFSLYSLAPQESRPCACEKCLTEGDPWFREIITASPPPLLSRKYATSEDVFNWWKRLQSETRNFTFYKQTVNSLFQIFPPVPDVIEQRPDRCRTCAVVGNSGNLKGSHYGPLIDFHDFVISYANVRANKDLVMILNPAFMKYVHEVWLEKKGKYPSTGFLTVALSLQICDEVSVFGFGADRDGNWNHYFEVTNKNLRTGPHAGTQEYNLILKLYEQQKIKFFKGQ